MLPTQVSDQQQAARPWAAKVDIGPPRGHEYIPSLEDCGTLPALVETVEGHRKVRSYWKPDAEELAALNAGQSIELVVFYWPMVPVALNIVP